ncbi:MAG: OmpA family protein [Paracoccaceae bacterium]
MIRSRRPVLLAGAALLALTACTDPATVDPDDPRDKTRQGVLMGGALGAVTGLITGDNPDERRRNALRGAVIGGVAGGVIGARLDRQEADLRRDLDNDDVRIENTGESLIVTLPQDILFATDSTQVRADLRRDLQSMAGNLQAYPDSTVQIVGHTDNVGDAGYNQDLSERRAGAVASVLLDAGVSPGRIRTMGRGEAQPVSSNLTPEGRAQNRRVEIVIVPTEA